MALSAADRELACRVEALTERVGDLVEALSDGGVGNSKVQQSVHMGGFATGICIAACVCALFFSVACAIFESRSYMKIELEVEQLKAWNDVTRKDIARLQAQMQEKH